ncbi:transcriptional regulator [Burkholderia sp. SCN-KJ]|uniref:transcriptional regulator n=1 Tax=Burkholderia sp. SCN-KJ TaxID=2969248 RepID=UPI0021505531|nr:transcriptional regulator [Burkholderia sp. SCN-KJ]MCR4469607.1 transcriptional regulator [Burkholderia sp. SCN-KJ]
MSDHDVNAYAQQVKHPPVTASSAAAVKPGRQTVRQQSKAPVAAHAGAKPAPNAHAAPAKTGKVQHAAGAEQKAHVAAKPKAAPAHMSTAARH